MHTHSPSAGSVPTPHHLTEDPALRLAAELRAIDPEKDRSAAEVKAHCARELAALRTKPTTTAGAVAVLELARQAHQDQHRCTGDWRDPYEAATNAAMANVAELLRTATWGSLALGQGSAPEASLHAEYADAVERVARNSAGLEPSPKPLDWGGCPNIEAMFRVEDRIMAEPTRSLPMLALRLMATFCTYQRCEDDNTNTLDALRRMRDEAAALAGLGVIDEWAAVDRMKPVESAPSLIAAE